MLKPKDIVAQINGGIHQLVRAGLADHQIFPAFQRHRGNVLRIVFQNAGLVSVSLKDLAYEEIYERLVQDRAYNVKLLDGALLQAMYEFSGRTLVRHRLAFFPSPYLEQFRKRPETYLNDEVDGDVVGRRVVRFPFRFDYDGRDGRHRDVAHPLCHMTLGQYEDCRIPVSAPLTPYRFVDFVLRNFYDTESRRYAETMPAGGEVFKDSITSTERQVVHLVVPGRRRG